MNCGWCVRPAIWMTTRGDAACGEHAIEIVYRAGWALYPVEVVTRPIMPNRPGDLLSSGHRHGHLMDDHIAVALAARS